MNPQFLLERAKEPSTWRGLALFASALGITIKPEAIDYIAALGMGASGLIGMFTADKGGK